MADFSSSLPVRTESAGDLAVKIVDSLVTSQQLKVNADGSINVVTSDLDVRDLVFATDKVDVSGSAVTVSNTVAVSSTDLDIRDLAFATDSVDVSGSDVTVSNTVTVSATDLDVRNLSAAQDNVAISDGSNSLAINADGSINSQQLETVLAIRDYNTAAAVASNASSTHTYTALSNFLLKRVMASASGKMKIEVQINDVTVFVQFNSTANSNMTEVFEQPLAVTTAQTVKIIRTNLDKQSQDLYSTIIGKNA